MIDSSYGHKIVHSEDDKDIVWSGEGRSLRTEILKSTIYFKGFEGPVGYCERNSQRICEGVVPRFKY